MTSALACPAGVHPRTEACSYQVAWKINPHMRIGTVDPVRAAAQHAVLTRTLRGLGARLVTLPFVHGAFDSVFAKDNAVYVRKDHRNLARLEALLAAPRHEERRLEQGQRARDLRREGVHVHTVAAPFEGGDLCVLPGGEPGALLGHGFRSTPAAVAPLVEILGRPVTPLELVDPALYHLDTALAALSDGAILACLEAFAPASRDALRAVPGRELIAISRSEAIKFALNFVEVGDTIVTGTVSVEVEAVLRARGKRVIVVPLDEFQRAGGSAACLLAPVDELQVTTQARTAAIRSTAA